MRAHLSGIATLLIVAATGAGCGGGTDPAEFTTVEVTAATTAPLFTVAPGNTVTLSVAAKDQRGNSMAGAGSPTFSSSNAAIASVGANGTVTAVAAGTVEITASLTVSGLTKTGSTTVTTQVAPANADVTAPGNSFLPGIVDVRAGGTVTWTFGATAHEVNFTDPLAPASIPSLQDGWASRTFPTNGNFYYQCTGPQMSGTVRVH